MSTNIALDAYNDVPLDSFPAAVAGIALDAFSDADALALGTVFVAHVRSDAGEWTEQARPIGSWTEAR